MQACFLLLNKLDGMQRLKTPLTRHRNRFYRYIFLVFVMQIQILNAVKVFFVFISDFSIESLIF